MAVVVLLNRETDVVLRDGSILHVRPASPADEASIRAFLDRLSAWSLHLRFGTAAPNLEAAAQQWALPTTRGHVSLLAITGADHQVVGEASYAQLLHDRAATSGPGSGRTSSPE